MGAEVLDVRPVHSPIDIGVIFRVRCIVNKDAFDHISRMKGY